MGTLRSFMFHDVRNLEKTSYPKRYSLKSFLNENQFKHQIGIINRSYKIISSSEIRNIDLKRDRYDYAVLTFDDGLLDHFFIYKYLKSINLVGTFLVPKMPVVENKVMNTHKIQFILASEDEKIIKNEILSFVENKEEVWNQYSVSKWKNNWWTSEMIFITNFLRKHKEKNINNFDLTNYFFRKFVTEDESNFSKNLYLDEIKIEEMSNNGMIIGGHGDISENLLLVDDYKKEINESKNFISKYSENFTFSYPNGGYDESIKNYMNEINCSLSFTIENFTLTELDKIDYLSLPRYDSPQTIELP